MMRSAKPSDTVRAFTLLEVMIAVVIFSIALSAIFVTFRTGISAWRLSHTTSETFQSAQQAQEVILSDLTRCFFMQEGAYNLTFNSELQLMDKYESQQRDAANMDEEERTSFLGAIQNPGITPEMLAKPVNLKFQGRNQGRLDEIEFARHQSPWTNRADYSWGVKRVRYFVEGGVLYREEKDPFGLPSGQPVDEFIADRFAAEDSSESRNTQRSNEQQQWNQEDIERFVSDPPVVEPLCDGVELFNIAYGYYKRGEWIEADDWDSSGFNYRFPESELGNTISANAGGGAIANVPVAGGMGGGASTESFYTPSSTPPGGIGGFEQRIAAIDGELVTFQVEQDDLPAYCAIQLGVREQSEGGRLRSFTFFISLAESQERLDASALEETEALGIGFPGR